MKEYRNPDEYRFDQETSRGALDDFCLCPDDNPQHFEKSGLRGQQTVPVSSQDVFGMFDIHIGKHHHRRMFSRLYPQKITVAGVQTRYTDRLEDYPNGVLIRTALACDVTTATTLAWIGLEIGQLLVPLVGTAGYAANVPIVVNTPFVLGPGQRVFWQSTGMTTLDSAYIYLSGYEL